MNKKLTFYHLLDKELLNKEYLHTTSHIKFDVFHCFKSSLLDCGIMFYLDK